MRRLIFPLLLLAPACFVDVPDLDDAEFACFTSDDCTGDFACVNGRCRDFESDACAGVSCPDFLTCDPDAGEPDGHSCRRCDEVGNCGNSGDVCAAAGSGSPDPYWCVPPCTFDTPCNANGGSGYCGTVDNGWGGKTDACGFCPNNCSGGETCRGNPNGVNLDDAAHCAPSGPTLVSITIAPDPLDIPMNGSASVVATGHYNDASTTNVTGEAVWSIADGSIAAVDGSSGLVTSVAPGTTNVLAAVGLVTGKGTVNVLATGPDYQVTAQSVPGSGTPGGDYTIGFRIRNGGDANGGNTVFWFVHESTNATFESGDPELANGSISALPINGESPDLTMTLTWPATSGSYWIVLRTAATDDINQSNDVWVSPAITVSSAQFVDYSVVVSSWPAAGVAGVAFSHAFDLTNVGTASATQSANWNVWASRDTVVDSSADILLANDTRGPFGAGYSESVPYTAAWPTTAEDYYLLIDIIPGAEDTNGGNNIAISPMITVSGPKPRVIAVGENGTALWSEDGGSSWTQVSGGAGGQDLFGVATDSLGHWVAVGRMRSIWHSEDNGNVWQQGTVTGSSVANDLNDVAYFNGQWVVAGNATGGESTQLYSSDGKTWDLGFEGTNFRHNAIVADTAGTTARWIAVCASGAARVSDDSGATYFTDGSPNVTGSLTSVAYDPTSGRTVACDTAGQLTLTDDGGSNWQNRGSAQSQPLNGIATNDASRWVAVGGTTGPVIVYSATNADSWSEYNGAPGSQVFYDVVWDSLNGRFIAVGGNGMIAWSPDAATNWISVSTGGAAALLSVAAAK